MKNLLLCAVWFLMSSVALGQYATGKYIADAGLYQRFVDAAPSWLIALVPMLIGLMILCRALAEILFIFKDKTEAKWDNKAWDIITKTAGMLATILGQIGIGMPNKMIEQKAEAIAEKKDG